MEFSRVKFTLLYLDSSRQYVFSTKNLGVYVGNFSDCPDNESSKFLHNVRTYITIYTTVN